jgi:hypothetical protein
LPGTLSILPALARCGPKGACGSRAMVNAILQAPILRARWARYH